MPIIDSWPEPPDVATTVKALSMTMDILPSGYYDLQKDIWTPRLKVDGTEVQIQGDAVVTDGENDLTETLSVNLLNPADQSLFTSTASIDFGIGRIVAGVWESSSFIDLITGGQVDTVNHTITGPPNQPKDEVQVQILTPSGVKLTETSLNGTIIYDPTKTSVDPADIKPIKDADGNLYAKTIVQVSGLTLGYLLNYVFVTKCGFTAVHSDLPINDWRIQRYEVNMGERYWDGLKGFLGVYNPAVTVINDEVWVTDPTKPQPTGFPAPVTINLDRPLSIQTGSQRQRLDAYDIQYNGLENNYDYTTFLYEYLDNAIGLVTRTLERITIEFRKITSPTTNVIVRSALNIENQTVEYSGVGTIQERSEVNEFDAKGQIVANRKQVKLLLHSGSTVYDGSSLQDCESETEEYEYAVHPFKPKSDYIASRRYNSSGLIARFNRYISSIRNTPLEMKADTAARSGWLTTTTTLTDVEYDWVTLRTKEETATPLRNGNVSVHIFDVDERLPTVLQDKTEERPGDISQSSVATHQEQLLVFAVPGASRTAERIETLAIGELPLKYGIALARRKLKQRQADAGTVQIPVLGYDGTLIKGWPVSPVDRDGTSLGSFLITGRKITINKQGVVMDLSGRVMAASTGPLQEVESYATVIASGGTLSFTLPVECTTGYSMFVLPDPLSDLTVTARHGHSGGYTNIVTTPLSLTAWDGTTPDFDFVITAGSVSVKTRKEFQIIVDYTG